MHWFIPVSINFGFKFFIVFRKYMLVGTLIMHNPYFAKVTRRDKLYF